MTDNLPKLAITLLLGVGAVAGFSFYLKPEWAAFRSIRQETDVLGQTSEELDVLNRNYQKLLAVINSVSAADIERTRAALPQTQEGAQLLTTLEALANRHGLALKQIDISVTSGQEQPRAGAGGRSVPRPNTRTPAPSPAANGVRALPITLSVNGSYEAFKGFLRDLESNLRIIDVEGIAFKAAADQNALDVTLKIQTYYQ